MTSLNHNNNLCLSPFPTLLTESIDWLIQVRHGGDGKGLDELAKALKKLIEEAIEKAEASLKERESKLLCTGKDTDKPSTSSPDSPVQPCCQEQDEEIKKHKDALKKLTDPNNAQKSENASIKAKIKKAEDAKNDCAKTHHLPQEEREKGLDEVKQQRTIVEKLQKFAESLTKNGTNSNILTHLCDGLQTFLGFNSATKGYDGTGIVYSDLDRLCDAVMGFLSGVLDAVKDDDAVKTYDKYISGDKIDTVISKLQSSIGSGRAGLVEAVGAVKGWLEGYNKNVNEKTKNVENDFSWLLQNLNGNYKNRINENDSLQNQLTAWTDVVQEIADEVNKIEIMRVSELDKVLREKIMSEIRRIKSVVDHMKKVGEDWTFKGQAAQVDRTLEEHKQNMMAKIKSQSKELEDKLSEKIGQIFERIDNLKDEKIRQFGRIRSTMRDARKFLENTYDGTYKDYVVFYFDAIKQNIREVYHTLLANKAQLAGLIGEAQKSFVLIQTEVGDKTAGPPDSIYQAWDLLKIDVMGLVNKIKGEGRTREGGQNENGLRQIVDGVKAYAEGFGQEAFKTEVLTKWVEEIVNKGGSIVSNNIHSYAFVNRDKGALRDKIGTANKAKAVQQAIIDKLPEYIYKDVETVALSTLRDTSVAEMSGKLNRFAEQVGRKLTGTNAKDTVAVAVQDIGRNLGMAESNPIAPLSDDTNLTSVVKAILSSLVNNFTQVASEVQRFGEKTKIAYITEIIEGVNKLKVLVDDTATGTYSNTHGDKIDKALQKLTPAINALGSLLGKRADADGTIQWMLNSMHSDLATLDAIQKEKRQNDDLDGLINERKEEARSKMETLKQYIESHLSNIKVNVEMASNALTEAIETVQKTVHEARKTIDMQIAKLKIMLTEATKKAFVEVSKQVTILFAESHRADLSTLRSLVDQQLKAVQEIIAKDRVTGVKGMLKTLSGVSVYVKSKMPPSSSDTNNMLIQLKSKIGEGNATLSQVHPYVKTYLRTYLMYIIRDIKELFEQQTSPKVDYSPKVTVILDQLEKLFDHLEKAKLYAYDHIFVDLRNDLNGLVTALHPSSFADSPSPLLSPLKAGLSNFAQQLGHAYVNRYSGRQFNGALTVTTTVTDDTKQSPNNNITVTDLTPEGRNCAKVCLTIVEMVVGGLTDLSEKCKGVSSKSTISLSSDLGASFKRLGYRVASHQKVQDGELRRHDEMKGSHVLGKINATLRNVDNIKTHLQKCESNEKDKVTGKKKEENFKVFDVVKCVHRHVETYYTVSHYATFTAKRTPCSVYEMLLWCSGLPYSAVYDDLLRNGIDNLLEEPDNAIGDITGTPVLEMHTSYLNAYPNRVTYKHFEDVLSHICATSHDVLTTILGTGDEYTTYASDFCTNALRLKYPATGEECLDMLVDILRRLFLPLRFLEGQCGHPASSHGWSDCLYGKDVPTTKSHCDIKSRAKATCEVKRQPTCRPNSQPNCQPTSPLMSYLHDSLPGLLPHNLTAIGCKYDCSSCSKSGRGMPCLTPLGFRGFSGSTRKGEEIYDVIDKFFSNIYVSSLFALQAKAPASLPEHFGFTLSLVSGWDNGNIAPVRRDLENAIRDVSIALYEDPTKLTTALSNAYGSNQNYHRKNHHDSKNADLSNLSMSSICSDKNHCAPYLASLCSDQYQYAPVKLSKQYLSWVTYLPWDFWKYLNDLYKAFCAISCQDWGCRTCLRGDKCNGSGHGMLNPKQPGEGCQCSSVVSCKGVSPTLYKYGFRFAIPWKLHDNGSRKTCFDFRSQLNSVLQSQYFKDLFEKCDEFLWTIRTPFSYLVLALWLLSLLYLLHILIIRLDLLHIKSHLHSPSSHRIAAQSLLAAARVNKLHRVFYLQP